MSAHPSLQPLAGPEGEPTRAVRRDGAVLRPVSSWTPAVHALLRHLEAAGFDGCPRLVGDGYDGEGHEVLTYVEGTFVHPRAWSDEGVWQVGALLRRFHDAVAGFQPPADARWLPRFADPATADVIGHGDTGPWNIVARDGRPVALIDWDFAGPIERSDEVAATGWLNAQLHDDDIAERNGLPDAAGRAAQLRHFLDGYGLAAAERVGLVERMAHYAIRDCAWEAAWRGVTRESTDPEPLWALAWRARSAAWILRHRRLLERAVTG
jgi:Ser/Thr protein kinase RdoA (MazF antagonist)